MTNLKYLMLLLASVIVCGQEVIPDMSNICVLPPAMGMCRANIPFFFYNPETNACDCFVYGGCLGNENRFETLDECMKTCNVLPSLQENTAECDKVLGRFNPLANKEVLDAIKGSVRPTQIQQDPTDPSNLQPAQQILQPAPQILQPAPQILQPAPQILQPAPQILQPAPQILQPAPQILQPATQILQPAPQILQPAPQTSQSLLQLLQKARATQQRVPLTQQPLPQGERVPGGMLGDNWFRRMQSLVLEDSDSRVGSLYVGQPAFLTLDHDDDD